MTKTLVLKVIWLSLALGLMTCSQQVEPKKNEGLAVVLVDKDGNAVQDLGKERTTSLYLKVISQPEEEVSGTVQVLGDACTAVTAAGDGKISLNSRDEKTGLLNSSPIKVDVLKECQPGEKAQVVLTIELNNADTGEATLVEVIQTYDIISLGDLPELMLVAYKINGEPGRPAVLFGEKISFEVSLKNIGTRDLTNAHFTYSLGQKNGELAQPIKIGEEELSIGTGKTLRIVIPGEYIVELKKHITDEVVLNVSWFVKGEAHSDGSLDFKIPVQRGLVVQDVLKQLVLVQSENGAIFKERIPLDFVLHNESDLILPVGHLWVEKVIGAQIEKPHDQIMLRKINPGEKIFIDGKNRLELILGTEDQDLFTLTADARIEVVLKWQLGDQPEQGTSIFIKRVEGELWHPAN